MSTISLSLGLISCISFFVEPKFNFYQKTLNHQLIYRVVEPRLNWYICSTGPKSKVRGLSWMKEWKGYWNRKLAVRLDLLEWQDCYVTGFFKIKTFHLWRKFIKNRMFVGGKAGECLKQTLNIASVLTSTFPIQPCVSSKNYWETYKLSCLEEGGNLKLLEEAEIPELSERKTEHVSCSG